MNGKNVLNEKLILIIYNNASLKKNFRAISEFPLKILLQFYHP